MAPVVRVVPRHLQDGLDGPSESLSHLVHSCPNTAVRAIAASMPTLGGTLAKYLRFNNPLVLDFVDRVKALLEPPTPPTTKTTSTHTTHTAATAATTAASIGNGDRDQRGGK